MELVLVRHGVRDGDALSERGRNQVAMLGRALHLRGLSPSLALSSHAEHAQETARLLSSHLADGRLPVELDTLTPGHGPGGVDELVVQAEAAGVRLQEHECVLVVGHEGRLSDLVTDLCGARLRPIPHGGAVAICGGDIKELASGMGSVRHRYPTADHDEEALRAKVNSKMTVATFLAGFVFTALSTVLLLDRSTWPWHRVLAAVTLTASLALFIAAIYIYDQLGTPSGFWTDAQKARAPWRWLYQQRSSRLDERWESLKANATGSEDDRARQAEDDPRFHQLSYDGPIYWLMVRTSRRVFTPAVVLARIFRRLVCSLDRPGRCRSCEG